MKYSSAIVFSALSVAMVSSTVIEMNIHEEGYWELSGRVAGDPGANVSSALLVHAPAEFLEMGPPFGGYLNITTVDNEHIIAPNFIRLHLESGAPLIPAGFRSVFATEFARSYMMIPKNRQFVIDPANPRDFVHEGFLATTTSTNDENLQVRVSVSIMRTTESQNGGFVPSATMASTEIHDFLLVTSVTGDSFPQSIIQVLYTDLYLHGIPVVALLDPIDGLVKTFEIIGDLPDDVIDEFPIIEYRIHCDGGQDKMIQLHGHDYIGPLFNDRRGLRFHSGDVNFLGLDTLSEFALYVDNGNRTIGFGEPLVSH